MSAERLKEAATALRDAAEGVQVEIDDSTDSGRRYFEAIRHLNLMGFSDAGDHGPVTVALAVADWLEATAVRVEFKSNHSWRGSKQALATADAILAGGSS